MGGGVGVAPHPLQLRLPLPDTPISVSYWMATRGGLASPLASLFIRLLHEHVSRLATAGEPLPCRYAAFMQWREATPRRGFPSRARTPRRP
jgi:hypothetical protein